MFGWRLAERILASGTLVVLAASVSSGHEGIDATVQEVDALIGHGMESADLYLRRGELHRLAGRTGEALADYARARALDPSLSLLDLCQAAAEREAGEADCALNSVDRFLMCEPRSLSGLCLRASLLAALGRASEAVAAYDRAIDLCLPPNDPEPDWYLERARLDASLGGDGVDRALAGVEAGLGRLGPAIALELCALDLEVEHGRTEAALARLGRVMERTPRREAWLSRRGALLERAGRIAEARIAFEQARDALAAVSPARRQAPAFAGLEGSIEESLARLEREARP